MTEQQTELTLFTGTATPAIVLQDGKAYSKFYEDMKAQLASFVPDLSTDASRKAIASEAFKVTKTKTAIEAAAKKLTEDARALVTKVNASRNTIVAELDALRDEVRKPLTDWEAAEAARQERRMQYFRRLKELEAIPHGASSVYINDTLCDVTNLQPDPADFGHDIAGVREDREHAIERVKELLRIQMQAEQDAAELAILRRKNEEREAAELAAAQAKIEQEQAEQRQRDEEARQRQEADAAKEAQRMAVEREAERVRNEERAKHAAELKAEQERREAAEHALEQEAERQRIRKEIAAQRAQEEAAIEKRRQENREHRASVMTAVKASLMTFDVDENTARTIVLAIVAGQVPHTTITF